MASAPGGSGTPAANELTNQAGQWLQGMRDAAMTMAKGDKKEDDEAYSPFAGLQKAAVLQETRCFNDREINARKCIGILTRILWLLTQGDKLSRLETTEVFFGVTKLLQAKDQQMVRVAPERFFFCLRRSRHLSLPGRAARKKSAAPLRPGSARTHSDGVHTHNRSPLALSALSRSLAAPSALPNAQGAQTFP